jgi:hypothetical protein
MNGTLTNHIELLDSEILRIESVIKAINEKQRKRVSLEGFRQEIIGRFEEIGLGVGVRAYSTNVDGVVAFDIDIERRIEPKTFDTDRMVHEVTNDLLDLGEGGVISTKSKGGIIVPEGHKH